MHLTSKLFTCWFQQTPAIFRRYSRQNASSLQMSSTLFLHPFSKAERSIEQYTRWWMEIPPILGYLNLQRLSELYELLVDAILFAQLQVSMLQVLKRCDHT